MARVRSVGPRRGADTVVTVTVTVLNANHLNQFFLVNVPKASTRRRDVAKTVLPSLKHPFFAQETKLLQKKVLKVPAESVIRLIANFRRHICTWTGAGLRCELTKSVSLSLSESDEDDPNDRSFSDY